MTNTLRVAFAAGLFFLTFQILPAQNVQYRVELMADNQTYRVLMRPSVTWSFPNNNTLGAQVTILARTGTLTVTNLTNINGNWADVPPVVAPAENPDYDYFVFYLVSSTQMPFAANAETPLFTFKRAGGACTSGQVGLINNFVDPFMEPNSQNLNVGNYMATQGGGGSSNNLWNGNYAAGSANCQGDCQVEYILTEVVPGRYQVAMKSLVNWPPPLNTTATQQISVKVPTGGFVVSNLTNLVPGATYVLGSRNDHPTEEPNFDYLHFNLQNQSTALTYQSGTTLPLFTFENSGTCSPGKVWLTDNSTDPFMPPNGASINTGQQLTTFGYGSPDVPICIAGTGSVNCNTATPCSPPPPGTILGPDLSVCQGQSAQLQVAGAYTSYAWSPATGLSCTTCPNPIATPSSSTTYIVTVTNAASCVFKDTLVVNVTPPPVIVSVNSTQAGCGQGNGSITVSASGSGALEYSINNGTSYQSSPTFSNLAVGNYNIRVRVQGTTCASSYAQNPVNISAQSAPAVSNVTANNPTGCGLSNGSIVITASGGGGTLEYSINGGTSFQPSATFSGLAAGSYNVQVRVQGSSCLTNYAQNPVVLNGPSAPIILQVFSNNPSDCGLSNGSVGIVATGNNLQFSINGGSTWTTSNYFGGLAAGNYPVAVRDAVSTCSSSGNIVALVAPQSPVILSVTPTAATDCGVANGSLSINAASGQAPLEYSINNGAFWQTSNLFSGLAPGNYIAWARNANNTCPVAASAVVVGQPSAPSINSVAATQPTACGSSNGSIVVTATAGQGSVEYSVNGTAWQSSGSFLNLAPGSYTVMVRHAGGACPRSFPGNPVVINAPQGPAIVSVAAVHPSDCGQTGNGTLTIVAAPNAGVEYSINGGSSWQASPIFTNLSAGAYQPRVRTTAGTCENTYPTVTLTQPVAATISSFSKTDVSDCGANDGSIGITASGGLSPLEYSINGTFWQTSPLFSGLAPGSYTLRVRNFNGTCVSTHPNPAIIGNLSGPSVSNVTKTAATCGQSNGSISITASGGQAPLEYSVDGQFWQSSNTFANLAPGTYNCFARNADNTCPSAWASNPVVMSQPPAPQITSVASGNVTDCSLNDGFINITAISTPVSGQPLQYSINGGATWQSGGSFQNLAAGAYSIVVRNASGTACPVIYPTVSILGKNGPTLLSATGSNPTNCGTSNGQISITAFGGQSPLEYSLDGQTWVTANIFQNLPAGSYTPRVRNSDNSCVQISPTALTLTAPAAVSNFSATGLNPTTCGGSNGSITVSVAGSTSGLQFSLNGYNWQSGTVFAGLAAGSYTVFARKSDGTCVTPMPTNPVVLGDGQGPTINLTQTADPQGCGATNGSITIFASGSNLEYSVNGGQAFQSSNHFPNLAAGVYALVVRAVGSACSSSATATLSDPPAPSIASVTPTPVSNCGSANGSVAVVASGGVAPLEYSINGGLSWQSSGTFSNLSAGAYSVSVRNANGGCTVTAAPVTVTAPSSPAISGANATAPTFCGQSNGSISITASGGQAPLEFSIDNQANWLNSNVFQDLAPGSYQVWVRNADNSCPTAFSGNPVVVPSGASISIANVAATNPTNCANANNGSIVVTANGGGANLEFSINGGQSFQSSNTFSGLVPGTYSLVARVVGSPACTAVTSATLSSPAAPVVSSVVPSPATDCGTNNGSISITASVAGGGTLEYSINNGANFQSSNVFSGLAPGTYNIMVRTAGGACTASGGTATVTGPTLPTVVSVNSTAPTSCGATNGSLQIAASGGVGPLEFSIDGGQVWLTSSVFNNLAPGNYQIWVRNGDNSCPTAFSGNPVSIAPGPVPSILSIAITNPQGCGSTDGSLAINASGFNLEYSINDGVSFQASSSFSGLAAGVYPVVVRQAGAPNCSAIASAMLSAPSAPSISGIVPTAVSDCNLQNGSLTVSTSGGQAPLQFSVNGGASWQTSNVFSGLAGGTYTVSVRNANGGCTATAAPVTVPQPSAPTLSTAIWSAPTNCGDTDGFIMISASGGQAPLEYSADNINWTTNPTISNLGPGTYQALVRNANGSCATAFSGNPIVLGTGQGPVIDNVVASNPTDCANPTNGSISILATGSNLQFSINGGQNFQNNGQFTGLAAGSYSIVVRQNGQACSSVSGATLTAPSAPLISNLATTNVTDCNLTNGSITVAASGVPGPLQFSNNNGASWQSSNVFQNLAGGTYTVSVRNAGGFCTTTATAVSISAPSAPLISAVNGTAPQGCGQSDGSISIAATGANGVEYSIDNGSTWGSGSIFNNLAAGSYQIWVRNADNSCPLAWASNPLVLPGGQGPQIVSVVAEDPKGCGTSDGSLTVNASGFNLEFSINGGQIFQASNFFTGLAAGVYAVVVRSSGACTATASATLAEPATPVIANISTTPSDCQNATGSITVAATGGSGPLQFSISNGQNWQTSNTFPGLVAGAYSVSVRNGNGSCAAPAASVSVANLPTPSITSVSFTAPSGCSSTDGVLVVQASANTPGTLEFSADGGQTWQTDATFTGLTAGAYFVRARFANSTCTAVYGANPVVLNAPQGPQISSIQANDPSGCSPNGSITISASGQNLEYSVNGGQWFQSSHVFTGLPAGTYQIVVRQIGQSCETLASATLTATASAGLVEYLLEEIAPGKYRVSMKSNVDWPVPQNLTANQQVAIKVPTGGFQVGNLTSLVSGANYVLGSRSDHPAEEPTFDYLHFNLAGATSALTYQNGVTIALFTFENIGTCSPGSLRLVDNASDPFLPPNSAQINTGQQLTTLGYGQPDVPICIGGTGEADCSVAPCPAPTTDILGPDRVVCAGESLQLIAAQGFTTYSWSPATGLSCTACANPVANPSVTTKYVLETGMANGCVFKDSIVLTLVQKPSIATLQTEDPQGCGVNNGSILVNAGSGGGLEFSINGGQSFQASNYFPGLVSGAYAVVVRVSGQQCSTSANVNLAEPAAPVIANFASSPTDCNASTGSIALQISGGQAPLEFSINGGASWQPSPVFANLAAGVYTLSVRNANGGCTQTSLPISVENAALPQIVSVAATDPLGCGANNGNIIITATGASADLEYSVSGGAFFTTSNVFGGLPAGTYTIAVREPGSACSATRSITLSEASAPAIQSVLASPTDCAAPTGSVTVTATQAQNLPLQFSINGGASWQMSNTFTGLAAGQYTVSVRNANGGCTVTAASATTVSQPPQASFVSVNAVSPTSCTSQNGTISVLATGGQGPLQYSIDNMNWSSTNVFAGLAPGNYQVWVRNANGSCAFAFSGNPVVLGAPQAPTISNVQATSPTDCANPTNGSITISASGQNLEYSINGGTTFQSSPTFNGLSAGAYQIAVREVGSVACLASSTTTLSLPTPPVISAITPTASACGSATGTVTVSANVPSGVLEYSINNGATWQLGNTFTGLAPGQYAVLVRRTTGFCTVTSALAVVGSVDNQAPSLVCPNSVFLTAPQGQNSVAVNNLPLPTASDNCSGVPAMIFLRSGATVGSGAGSANGTYNIGTTLVTYTATDASGNTASCSFSVTVQPFGAIAPILLKSDTLTTPCDVPNDVVLVPVRVSNFTDIASLRFDVAWNPAVLSIVAPPADLIDNNGFGLTTNATFYSDTLAGRYHFAGASANPSGWPDLLPGSAFVTLRFRYKNPALASAIDFQNIVATQAGTSANVPPTAQPGRVQANPDLAPPLLSACPQNVTVAAPNNQCTQQVALVPPTATDNCATAALPVLSSHPSNVFDVGVTTVVFTATDHKGQQTTCSATVTVTSNVGPQFSGCPNNINVNLLNTACEGAAFWVPPAAFNTCSTGNFTVNSNFEPGDIFQLGMTQVVYTATDALGQTASCVFTVNVRDLTPPSVQNCPTAPVTVNPQAGNCFAIGDWAVPVFVDNCTAVQVTSTKNPGDNMPIGNTTVTYTATDAWGNTATCAFVVQVPDVTPPVLQNCPSAITISANATDPVLGCGAMASWNAPNLVPVCSLTGNTLTSSIASGAFFPLGSTRVTYYAANPYGVRDSCSFLVTVQDVTPPSFATFPQDLTIALPADRCDTLLSWAAPLVLEDCELDTLFSNLKSGDVLPVGAHVVTYTAIDESGNVATRTFSVLVRDAAAPDISNCPSDITVNASGNDCDATAAWPAILANDNCDPAPALTSSHTSGQSFPGGQTPVTIVAQDDSQNADTCRFTVTVLANGTPALQNCPPNQLLFGCQVVATWVPPTAAGFCDTPILTADHASGDLFAVGTTYVTYTATDGLGTQATCSFYVTVNENVAPVVNCPEAIEIDLAGRVISDPDDFVNGADSVTGCAGVDVTFGDLTATDNCSPTVALTQTSGPTLGGMMPLGQNTLTFRAEDEAGNTALCTISIKVVPPPEIPSLTADPVVGCDGAVVNIRAVPVQGANYRWTKPDGTSFVGSNQFAFLLDDRNQGDYIVEMLFNGCPSEADTVTVYLAETPIANPDTVEVEPNEPIDIFILENDQNLVPDDAVATLTLPIDGVRIDAENVAIFEGANSPGAYVVFLYDVCSQTCPTLCSRAKVIIHIKDKECEFIPNVITPNSDDANDAFVIPCIDRSPDGMPDNHLVIYNQWGDRVYEAQPYLNDVQHAWRGTLFGEDGKYLPDGVYYYIFRPSSQSKTVIKGFVEIYR